MILAIAAPAVVAQSRSNLDFFIDLAGENVGEAMQVGSAPSGIAIDGIPLKLGVTEDAAAEGWYMVAGARGGYTFALDHGLDLVARGNASRATFFDDPMQDRAAASGAAELRLTRGAWQFGLTPGVAVTRWTAGTVTRDGSIDGRLARPITDELRVVASGRYRQRFADGVEAFHSEAAGGRIGFTYRLPPARLELAYAARREIWSATSNYWGPDSTFARGPALSAALPLDRELKFKAGYSFTETTNEYFGGPDAAETIDRLHQVNLGFTWDVGGRFSDLAFSVEYRFEHASTQGGASEERHAGTVNLALGF